MKIEYPEGATPIDQDELSSLLLPITTQSQLNSAEKEAIFECQLDLRKDSKLKDQILTTENLRELHRKMFFLIWDWAGKYRKTEKNIGVAPYQIQIKLHELCLNSTYRLTTIDSSTWPEFAAQFHHALVAIHPFPNGNGRHARLATEILSQKLKQKMPSWGGGDLGELNSLRAKYISALKSADKGDFKALTQFTFY